MTRSLLLSLCALVFFTGVQPAQAQRITFGGEYGGNAVTDPNHRGYVVDEDDYPMPVRWSPVKADCDPCQSLAAAYNQAMQSLMNTRYWIEEINSRLEDDSWENFQIRQKGGIKSSGEGEGLDAQMQKAAADALDYKMSLDDLAGKLPALQAQEESLKTLSDDLFYQLQRCEENMCRGGQPKEYVEVIGKGPAPAAVPLPFDWKGPYPEVCTKCAKLAARLNELPTLARVTMAGLEAARSDLMFAEMEIQAIQMEHNAIGIYKKGEEVILPSNRDAAIGAKLTAALEGREKDQKAFDKRAGKKLEEQQRKKAKAEQDIEKYEADLDAITKNFADTLKAYNDCVPTCEKKTGSYVDPGKPKEEYAIGTGAGIKWDAGSCFAKLDLNTAYTLGANSEYGSGAAVKDKVKNMATGAATSALGGLLGGGGVRLGSFDKGIGAPMGNDRDSGSSGPDLDRNPLKGGFYSAGYGGFELGTRAGFTDKGFVIDQKITDSPDGNSTFHTAWLQDIKGRVMLPSQYYIFDIYRDHKLTVWWTYDHWTDGVHDDHDEGRETTEWRENLGSLKLRFDGAKGIKDSIWYQSGFDTAVKGVREYGALYHITPEDLKGCGLNAVTYLTLPSEDPVKAVPFAVNIHLPDDADGMDPRQFQIQAPPF